MAGPPPSVDRRSSGLGRRLAEPIRRECRGWSDGDVGPARGEHRQRRLRLRLSGRWVNWREQVHERTFRVAEDRAERGRELAQQHVPGQGRAVAVERRDLGGQAGGLGRVVELDHVGVGLGLGEDGRRLVLGGLELGLGDLELLLGQRHGHLLLLLGLGGLLDDLLLGLDHAFLLLGQHDLDLQFRLGELLELLAHGTGRASAWRPRAAAPAR